MRARAHSIATGRVVPIDATIARGPPSLTVLGPDDHEGAIGQRVRAALGRCGVSLASASRRVDLHDAASPGLDLAIVAALLAAHRIVPRVSLDGALFWGALADDGTLGLPPGAEPIASLARAAGFRRLFVPAASSIADLLELGIVRLAHVGELVPHLRAELPLAVDPWPRASVMDARGLARVRGAIELMLAGQHHAFVRVTARESSTLVRRLADLLPQPDETLAADRLALGLVGADPLARVHVLDPNTPIDRVLGTHPAAPGPACLAHGGVLVIDDVHRYPPALLDHVQRIARGEHEGPRPAEFVVLATTRPRGRPGSRIPRPRGLDCVTVVAPRSPATGEQSTDAAAVVRSRIVTARGRQLYRFGPGLAWTWNAQIPRAPNVLDEFCPTSESGRALLDSLCRLHRWSTDQAVDLLRVARTVADLEPDRDPRAPLDRECIATAAMFVPSP